MFTFALDGGKVTTLGAGDLHERAFDDYGVSVTVDTAAASFSGGGSGVLDHFLDSGVLRSNGYDIVMYPSDSLYSQYITSTPGNACVTVVLIVVCTALLVFLFSYVVNRREKALIEEVKRTAVLAAAR